MWACRICGRPVLDDDRVSINADRQVAHFHCADAARHRRLITPFSEDPMPIDESNVPPPMTSAPPVRMVGKSESENPIDQILAERGKRYGVFTDHAAITQQLKVKLYTFRNGMPWAALTPDQQEALDMICHKIGRIINGDPNYADSWDDIAGYAKLVGDRLRGVSKG